MFFSFHIFSNKGACWISIPQRVGGAPGIGGDWVVGFGFGVHGGGAGDDGVVVAGLAVVEVETILAVELFGAVLVRLGAFGGGGCHQCAVGVVAVELYRLVTLVEDYADIALVVFDLEVIFAALDVAIVGEDAL